MTSTFIPHSAERLVESRDYGVASFSDMLDIARLADGRQVVVWDSNRGNGQVDEIWACLLDADGAPVGAPFRVNTGEPTAGGTLIDEWGPTVTARADGGFMIAWTGEVYNSGYNTGRDVIARQYDAAGTPLGDPYAAVYLVVQQSSGPYISTGSWEYNPGLATLADGRIAMVYESGGETWLRLLGDDGVTVLGSQRLDVTAAAGYHTDPEVTALEDGGYAVVWEGPDVSGTGIRASVFAADGTLLRADFQVNTETYSSQVGPEVTALAGGGFVVTWYTGYDEAAGGYLGTARAQMFDASGTALGGEIRLSGDFPRYGQERDVRAVGLPDGGFVAAFRVVENSQVDAEVFLQRVGADGQRIGESVRANIYQVGDQQHARLSLGPDGLLTVIWIGQGDDYYDGAEFDTVVSRSFRVAEFDGVPTPGDDAIAIGAGGQPVFLLEGNDWLLGSAAGDTVHGGPGNDSILVEAGDDVVYGGDGFDTIRAGEGNDTVHGGNGRDLVYLNQGNDIFFDNAQGGDLGRDTVFGGYGNDTIEGGNGDDVFHGEWGNDLINARLGNDLVYGGDGFDTIRGGAGDDTVFGGNGRDLVRLEQGNDVFNDNAQGGDLGRDTVFGGLGNDTIEGGNGDDEFHGEDGNDVIRARLGNDSVYGGSGFDLLDGGDGDDLVFGGLGRDRVFLGAGDDRFVDTAQAGDLGQDTITGGAGADSFVFARAMSADVITDYEIGTDRLEITLALAGGRSAAQIEADAQVTASGVLLDFGSGDTLLLGGLTDATGLAGDILLV